MGNTLFQAICRMGIFMICAQAVVHFRPKEAYEKYLKLLVSVMVLIQVFLPIGNFLLGEGGQDAADALKQFGLEMEERMREAEQEAAAADEILEEMTLEEVFRRLEEQRTKEREGQEAQGREEEAQGGEWQPEQDESPYVPEEDLQMEDRAEDQGGGQSAGAAAEPIEPVAIEPIVIEPIGDNGQ